MPITFRLLLAPILLPLSLIYGLIAFVYRALGSAFKVRVSSPVISVGNFCVGGSGKTPVVIEVAKALQRLNYQPVVVSKSYKAELNVPREVLETAHPLEVGDEPLLIKKSLGRGAVFSGPTKYKTLLFADSKMKSVSNKIYIIDDGAQHHKVQKDFKIHLWDLSRPYLDLFPFPFGCSREFWFLGESPNLSLLNRVNSKKQSSNFKKILRGPKIEIDYRVESLSSINSKRKLESSFHLISGVGNFMQLERAVLEYTKGRPLGLEKSIRGRDHDKFDWFEPENDINYLCTEKDLEKLKSKVHPDFLYVVKSGFSSAFQDYLVQALKSFLKL